MTSEAKMIEIAEAVAWRAGTVATSQGYNVFARDQRMAIEETELPCVMVTWNTNAELEGRSFGGVQYMVYPIAVFVAKPKHGKISAANSTQEALIESIIKAAGPDVDAGTILPEVEGVWNFQYDVVDLTQENYQGGYEIMGAVLNYSVVNSIGAAS